LQIQSIINGILISTSFTLDFLWISMGTSLCIPQTIRIPRDSSGVLVISLDLPQSTHIIPSGYQIDGEDNRKDPKRNV
jgi:hypothetical protein